MYANFDFSRKGLRLVSPPHFVYDFLRKMFPMFLLTDKISLPDCLYFLRYWAIGVCNALNFEVTLSFLTNSFSYMTTRVRTKIEMSPK